MSDILRTIEGTKRGEVAAAKAAFRSQRCAPRRPRQPLRRADFSLRWKPSLTLASSR